MDAITFHQHGGPDVLKLETMPDPTPGLGEAVVEVKAAAINHLDIFVRRGIPGHTLPLPHIPGSDGAGVIAAIGPGVTGLAVGDRVVINPGIGCDTCEFCVEGEPSLCARYRIMGEQFAGAYAQYVAMPSRNLLPMPPHLSFPDAAALPLTLLTAWRMMITRGHIQPGEDVLILGAGSGVGVMAIQIAKMAGARVFATASTEEKRARASQLGADVVIDPAEAPLQRTIRALTDKRGVDVVVDYVGEATWLSSLKSLRNGGRLLTCGATSGFAPQEDLRHIFFRQLQIIGSTMGSRRDLEQGLKAVARGFIRAVVHQTLPLADAREGQRLLEQREAFGKVVLIP